MPCGRILILPQTSAALHSSAFEVLPSHIRDLPAVAKACGYPYTVSVDNFVDLDKELAAAKTRGQLSFIEIKCQVGAREDLGRPTTTALENKNNFMEYING